MTLEQDSVAIGTGAEDIRSASEWLDRVCRQRDVPTEHLQRLDLCLNEVMANIACHGGNSALEAPVLLSLVVTFNNDDARAILTVSDRGRPFNPLTAASQPQANSLEEAAPGGLGLTMIRCYADGLEYDRHDGKNHLAIMVQWARSSQ